MRYRLDLFLKIRSLAREKALAGKFIYFIYNILKKPWIRFAVPILFTVALSSEFKVHPPGENWWRLASLKHMKNILIISGLYLIYQTVEFYISAYINMTNVVRTYLGHVTEQQILINGKIAEDALDLISYLKNNSEISNETVNRIFGYSKVGAYICKAVYEVISKATGEKNHQVTLFQKFKNRDGCEYIKMISYCNKIDMTPSSYNEIYTLNDLYMLDDEEYKKKYFHQKVFESNRNNIVFLKNKYEVLKEFVFNEQSREREEKIGQYIGIPIFSTETGLVSLLQIDTDVKNLFGKTNREIQYLCEYVFMPFGKLLLKIYNNDLLIKKLCSKVNNLHKYGKNYNKTNKERRIGHE